MERYIVSVDLGTTNIKTGVYNSSMEELSLHSTGVNYATDGKFVEFDPEGYWGLCKEIGRAHV